MASDLFFVGKGCQGQFQSLLEVLGWVVAYLMIRGSEANRVLAGTCLEELARLKLVFPLRLLFRVMLRMVDLRLFVFPWLVLPWILPFARSTLMLSRSFSLWLQPESSVFHPARRLMPWSYSPWTPDRAFPVDRQSTGWSRPRPRSSEVVSCLSLALLPEGRRRVTNKLDARAATMAFFFHGCYGESYCAFGLCNSFHWSSGRCTRLDVAHVFSLVTFITFRRARVCEDTSPKCFHPTMWHCRHNP